MAVKKSSIDTTLIRELADMLNDTNLGEIEVEEGELRIRVARGGSVVSAPSFAQPPAAAAAQAAAPSVAPEPVSASAENGTKVPSPMVGTAYLAAAPGAKPFVTEGQQIKEGDTLLIVEAMKTMNQIPSPASGTVSKIIVVDGQPVEFGETLIILE